MKCKFCGREFIQNYHTEKYCCSSCKEAAKKLQMREASAKAYTRKQLNKEVVTGTCEYCGETFIKTHGNQKYCSGVCASNSRLEKNADARMKSYHLHKKRGGDKFYGLGSGGLGPHRHSDFDLEITKIQNEMRRLGVAVR